MLKTSPILSPSANASPTGFRHPPSRTSQESVSSRPQPISYHRPSSRSTVTTTSNSSSEASLASAPSPAPRGRSAGDSLSSSSVAAVPIFASTETQVASSSIATNPSSSTQHNFPPRPDPQPNSASSNAPSIQNAGSSVNVTAQDALSPNKRRISPSAPQEASSHGDLPGEPSAISGSASVSGASDQQASSAKTSKRAKPEERPPKILPQRYELSPVEDMVELIAHMLGELIATNDAIRISSGGLTRFHSRTAPGISVRDYLHRLARHATLTPPLLLAMVYYIDRLCALYPEFTINTLTVHRFLITAATVAAKGLSDSFWNNTTYARVGGVRVAELKLLELEFLYRVDWKIVPNPEVLVAYYQGLVQRTPGYTLESDGTTDDDEIDEDDDDVDEDENDGQQQQQQSAVH